MVTKDDPPLGRLGEGGSALLRAWFEISHLKQLYRQGWLKRGVPAENCESVAEHSFAVAVLCVLLIEAHDLPLDREKALLMALAHDLGEIRAGDITPADGVPPAEKARREREAVEAVLAGAPGGGPLRAAWEEFEAGESAEARFVREVDRLEMGLQAGIYEHQGLLRPDEFLDSADRAVADPRLRALLDELRALRPESDG